jgi:sulfite exporter TauE/SafE
MDGMTISVWAGLALGFIGSLHCIGMCGPIALVLPRGEGSPFRIITGRVLYNLGRTITYTTLGLGFGFLGQVVFLAGYQQVLGIVIGSALILSVMLPASVRSRFLGLVRIGLLVNRIKTLLTKLLSRGSNPSLLLIGLCNGFLPCGLVYAAVAASLMTSGPLRGALFMTFFGAGTIPVMLALTFAGGILSTKLRQKLTRLIPITIALLGLLFILRGLSLGIPYLSPDVQHLIEQGQEHSTH